jgi:hypothetical protein
MMCLENRHIQWCPFPRQVSDPTSRTLVGMNKPTAIPTRPYYIVAVDPEADWRCVQFEVRAISRDEARRRARVVLAKDKRDHYGIECVVEAEAA